MSKRRKCGTHILLEIECKKVEEKYFCQFESQEYEERDPHSEFTMNLANSEDSSKEHHVEKIDQRDESKDIVFIR